jgi:hypothetical protein
LKRDSAARSSDSPRKPRAVGDHGTPTIVPPQNLEAEESVSGR